MAGFDRIKPPGERIERRDEAREPASEASDSTGRAALFSTATGQPTAAAQTSEEVPRIDRRQSSTPAPPSPAAQRPPPQEQADDGPERDPRLPTGRSILQVECSHCGITSPMPLTTAVKRALPLAVVLPTRSHPVFATCPCGERRTWLKPTLGLPR